MSRPPSLPRRPSAKSFAVEDLLQDVREGRLALPNFQRPLKWRQREAALLFDSILRGYPIGTLLLWKRPRGGPAVDVRPLVPDHPLDPDALVVVDGQQRLTSLARVLLRDVPEKLRWDLAWALDDERVRSGSARARGLAVPLVELLDSADLSEWVTALELRGADARRVFELGRQVREYQVPAYVIEADDEAAVRRIFQRANTSGKRLSADEIFTGLHGGGAGASIGTLQGLGSTLADTGFGVISAKWLHQAVLAIASVDPTSASGGGTPSDDTDVPALSIEAAELPLRQAIQFLVEDAAIPHEALVPYGIVIPTLAAFLSRHPAPSARNRELLRRWLYRGAVSGLHRGDRIPYRRAMLSAARLDDENDAVQALLGQVPRELPAMPAMPKRFVQRDALVRLYLLGIASLGPLDLVTVDPIDVAELADAASKLPRWMAPLGAPDDSFASRFWLPPRREPLTTQELAEAPAEVLASHGFDAAGISALSRGDPQGARAERRRHIQATTRQMLLERCRFGEPDRRPLAYEAAS